MAHIRTHGVEPPDAEEAFLDPRRLGAPAYSVGEEQRSGWIGATEAGRILFLITTRRRGETRIIAAREAPPAMKRRYRRRGK